MIHSLPAMGFTSLGLGLGLPFYYVWGGLFDIVLLSASLIVQNRHVIPSCLDLTRAFTYASYSAALFVGFQIVRSRFTTLETPRWPGLGKVALFPGKTVHARLFPKKHSFTYSYLVVGIPVGWEGAAGGMISTGVNESPSAFSRWFSLRPRAQKAWFDVDAADYLERGNRELGLRGKLDAYLSSQGVDPRKYPHAYLVTAARFLGYHFNPVSFWYLYDSEKKMAAMILEVNNTFDERRMYLLIPDQQSQLEGVSDEDGSPGAKSKNGIDQPSSAVFTQTWPKDFHVSPFNSRKGSYSLSAHDILLSGGHDLGSIDNTIVLRSSKIHGKIVARLLSTGPALDPTAMTPWQKSRFLVSWWWVGFVTFPRIVKEAGRLFFNRKLHVWFRPEPLKESMGRNADALERRLELIFRRYLRHLVEQSSTPLAVKYLPSGIAQDGKELMLSSAAKQGSDPVEDVEFKVLTPAFYSRFVQYAHDLEAIFCELQESHTIWISRPDLLPKFLFKKPAPALEMSNPIDFVSFKAIQHLRQRPARIERPMTWPSSGGDVKASDVHSVVDIRDFRISSMDGYVLSHETTQNRASYRGAVLKLFLAERTAFGLIPVLDVLTFALRAGLAWVTAVALRSIINS